MMMMSKYYTNLNLPPLDDQFISEALNQKFELIHEPSILICASTTFHTTDFFKTITSKFRCGTRYFLNPPHTIYDWHTDNKRSCAINWVIKTNKNCLTLYREAIPEAIPEINKRVVLYNVEEVVYNLYKPTLIDTTHEHCVINNSDESRIILSLTIWNTTYDEALFFLKNLNV